MDNFNHYLLSRHIVSEKQLPYYTHWVNQFYNSTKKGRHDYVLSDEIDRYLDLLNRRKEDWQLRQGGMQKNRSDQKPAKRNG